MFETVQSQCRLVDCVTVKGSQQPVSLYTYNVPDIQSRGGILPDDMRIADPSLSTKAFFRSVVPPATTFEFGRLHNAGLQLYLGGVAPTAGGLIPIKVCIPDSFWDHN